MAKTPETSDYTSIQARMKAVLDNKSNSLLPVENEREKAKDKAKDKAIPFSRTEYFSLVDWSGRAILKDKRGSIPGDTPPILYLLGINERDWVRHVQSFEYKFRRLRAALKTLKIWLEIRTVDGSRVLARVFLLNPVEFS